MKSRYVKKIIIGVFILLITVFTLYSRENSNSEKDKENLINESMNVSESDNKDIDTRIKKSDKDKGKDKTGINGKDRITKELEGKDISGVKEKDKIDKKEKFLREKKRFRNTVSKETAKEKVSKSADYTEKSQYNNGLLFVKDKEFLYIRIPEIKIEEEKTAHSDEIVRIPADEKTADNEINKKDEEGIFGLSKDSTSSIAKGSLIVLILLIFILYKIRIKQPPRKRVVKTINRTR